MVLKLGCLSFLFAWRFLKSYGYESLPTIYIKNISCQSVVFIIKLYIAFLSVCLQIRSFVTFLFFSLSYITIRPQFPLLSLLPVPHPTLLSLRSTSLFLP